jgi:starch synthase
MPDTAEDRKKINCLFTAVEADPLVKVGGLGDVAFALPDALRRLDPQETGGARIDVRLVLPCHSTACLSVDEGSFAIPFDVPTGIGAIPAVAYPSEIQGMPVYLISSRLIPQDSSVYSTDVQQDGLKFLFFSQAVLELARTLDWTLDVVHANDWHTAIIPHLLKVGKRAGIYPKQTKSLLTIHNLPFMGAGVEPVLRELGIPFSRDRHLPAWARKVPLPMGLSASDHINAVSPTYAKEITTPEYGSGLQDYLSACPERLSGILNGLDTAAWDPSTDQALSARFSVSTLAERPANKLALQREFGLAEDPRTPLLAFIGRMDQQKGIDLIIEALAGLQDVRWQAVILGSGNPFIEEQTRLLQEQLPDCVRAVIRFDSRLSRRIYGGADILLMPSRYEPCGLAQMIAMRYGCVPLAHATGGLIDTITDGQNGSSTGFLFQEAKAAALAETIRRALKLYENESNWRSLQRNGMRVDFSWRQSALQYANLYMRLLQS